jgi:branched-chain amino acid transport system permease protein
MNRRRAKDWAWIVLPLGAAVLYPIVYPIVLGQNSAWLGTATNVGTQLRFIFVFSILAMGLNVVVGYTGLLNLGIAAFFGIGAYVTGVLTVSAYPFGLPVELALPISALAAALCGLLLGVPTLRLRGDYLAIVTLGFGEVVRFGIKNLEEITAGSRGLNPVPPPYVVQWLPTAWASDYRVFYYFALSILVLVVTALSNLERSRLGRSWFAVREDELAASCMGINATRAKLSAFALGAGLGGLAGSLYASVLKSTAGPEAYDFTRSIIILCCVILGGLGSLRGTLLGVFLLIGFDSIVTPMIDSAFQLHFAPWAVEALRGSWPEISPENAALKFSNWRLLVFGIPLILMMRFRPEGLLPAARVQREMHTPDASAGVATGA